MPPTAADFLALHTADTPLLMPNPWDIGSARILAALGFTALATTSGGSAASLGRVDGDVTREEAITHAAAIGGATGLPINGDFENGFADDADGVAQTIREAIDAGVVAGSIEDWSGSEIYEMSHAVERVAAAAEAAHRGPVQFALTARAEGLLRRRSDLAETITRLQAYQAAGADVLFAPMLHTIDEVRAVVSSVDRPLSVLIVPGLPAISELAQAGVGRVSTGSAFAIAAYAALVTAANELRDQGTYAFADGLRDVYADVMRGAFRRVS
jgi:2-methylisocitrate lyase-like PEP mutase family enzyme